MGLGLAPGWDEVGAEASEWGWAWLQLLCGDCVPAKMAVWPELGVGTGGACSETWRPLSRESDGAWSISE